MRSLILFCILFSANGLLYGQKMNCTDFKTGRFVMEDTANKIVYKLERDSRIQTETVIVDGKVVATPTFHIKWIDSCSYTLKPTKETLKTQPDIKKGWEMTIEILSVESNSYWQETSSNFSKLKLRGLVRKEYH